MIRIPEYLEKRRAAAGGNGYERRRAGLGDGRRRRLRVLIAPDSFKGSLTSVEVAARARRRLAPRPPGRRAPARAARRRRRGDARRDRGGRRLVVAAGRRPRPAAAGRSRARWLRAGRRTAAVVEMAAGVRPVAGRRRRSATRARRRASAPASCSGRCSTRAIRDIALGIGGSATTDGGAGLLRGLGATVDDGPATVDLEGLDPRLIETSLRIACDVTQPAARPDGRRGDLRARRRARRPSRSTRLDAPPGRVRRCPRAATGRDERDTPGAGAAGGVGFALLSLAARFASLELGPGVDLVMEAAGFDEALAAADLVITGEGRIDEQTAFGKTALGVARRAQAAGVRCIAVGGGVTPEGLEALAAVGRESRAGRTMRPITARRGQRRGRRAGRSLRRADRRGVAR